MTPAPLLVMPDADDPRETGSGGIPDERLRLLCTACHPAMSRAAQVALTLRVIGGLRFADHLRARLAPVGS